MLFDIDKRFARVSERQQAPRRLEDRRRDVYDSHRHRVFSVSFYMTGSEMEAESILQDTFVRAFHAADEPDQAIVDGALVEQLAERVDFADEGLPIPASGNLPCGRNILRTDLEEALRCLPALERLVFLLMDVEGYPASRVAELLRKTNAEIFRTAITARLRLRTELALMRQDDEQAA